MGLLDDLEQNKEVNYFTFKDFKIGDKDFPKLHELIFKYICISDNKNYLKVQDKNVNGSVLNAHYKEEKFKKILKAICETKDFENLLIQVSVAYEKLINDDNVKQKAKTIEKVAKKNKSNSDNIIIHKDQKTINDFDNDIEEENPLAILSKTIKKD